MPSTVTLSNGQRIWMSIATGEVIDASQTHVTSVEQSAATVLSEKTIVPGHISSRTDVASELWLRMPDGRERSFNFQNIQVPARPGHRMSVLWGAPTGQEQGWYFGTRNHTTRNSNVDLTGAVDKNLKKWKLSVGGGLALLSTFIVCMLLGALITPAMSGGSDPVGHAVLGAVFGFIAAIMLTPVALSLVVGPRAKRLVEEIEHFARERLAERDPPDFLAVNKDADNRTPPAAAGSALKWAVATITVAVLGFAGWHSFKTTNSEQPMPFGKSRLPVANADGQPRHNAQASNRAPVAAASDWAAFNRRQMRRHDELIGRAPSASDFDAVRPELRQAAIPLAALYTLFPRGHERPFPAVVEMLRAKDVVHPGHPLSRADLDKIMQDIGAASAHVAPTDPERIARDLEAGKSVFMFDGGDLLRLTASQRDGNGRLTGFLVYDPAGRLKSQTSPSTLAGMWPGTDVVVSKAKAEH